MLWRQLSAALDDEWRAASLYRRCMQCSLQEAQAVVAPILRPWRALRKLVPTPVASSDRLTEEEVDRWLTDLLTSDHVGITRALVLLHSDRSDVRELALQHLVLPPPDSLKLACHAVTPFLMEFVHGILLPDRVAVLEHLVELADGYVGYRRMLAETAPRAVAREEGWYRVVRAYLSALCDLVQDGDPAVRLKSVAILEMLSEHAATTLPRLIEQLLLERNPLVQAGILLSLPSLEANGDHLQQLIHAYLGEGVSRIVRLAAAVALIQGDPAVAPPDAIRLVLPYATGANEPPAPELFDRYLRQIRGNLSG